MLEKAEGTAAPVKVEFDNFEHGFPEGFGPGRWGTLAYWIGIAFATFQLYVAAFNYLPSQVVRGVHVGFLLLLTFGLIGNFTAKTDFGRALGWIVGAAGFACGLYQWIFYADLIARDGDPTHIDLAVGTLLAVLIFEGTRRLMGLALPLMCGACLLYWFFGQYLPSPFNHRGYDYDQVISHLSFGTLGLLHLVFPPSLFAYITRPVRHGRACPGHPRLNPPFQDVDAGIGERKRPRPSNGCSRA